MPRHRYRHRPGFTMIELATAVAIIAVLISLLLPSVQAAREQARRVQCINNLTQIGIALWNYESTHRVLPPGVVNLTGPVNDQVTGYHFGWMTQILPFLEQRNLDRHFDRTVSLYSINNVTARSTSFPQLLCPSDAQVPSRRMFGGPTVITNVATSSVPDPALSSYAACHNDAEAPIDAGNNGVFFLNSRVSADDITDGLAHTFLVGEIRQLGNELGWASGTRATLRNAGTPLNLTSTSPMNLAPFLVQVVEPTQGPAPDPDNPIAAPPPEPGQAGPPPVSTRPSPVGGFGSWHPSGSNFLFGDGSVRFIRQSIREELYRRLANRADGIPIGSDEF